MNQNTKSKKSSPTSEHGFKKYVTSELFKMSEITLNIDKNGKDGKEKEKEKASLFKHTQREVYKHASNEARLLNKKTYREAKNSDHKAEFRSQEEFDFNMLKYNLSSKANSMINMDMSINTNNNENAYFSNFFPDEDIYYNLNSSQYDIKDNVNGKENNHYNNNLYTLNL